MRRTILAAVFSACLFMAAAASAGPMVDLEASSIDVGQALAGETVEGIFWISSPGDADLEIQKVSPG